jgi:hypothetical protein
MSYLGTISGLTRTFRRSGTAPILSSPRPLSEPPRRWHAEPTRAETLECTCPDFCERDHEHD